MPGAQSVGRMTACGYPPALRGIGGYRLWRYSPYGTFERASCLLLKLLVVLALASCFAFPGEFLLQASKRNQKTRPGIRPQPLLGWGALAASLLPAARRHGPSWTEAALAASCHSPPSATIPLGLLTGRVCRPTTWRASLTSWMPGTRSVGRITARGYPPLIQGSADTAYGGIRPTGLHGNERRRLAVLLFLEFLSCLYGSERWIFVPAPMRAFLSCLYGSELALKTYNHLKEKEIPSFSCQKPSFFEAS
ncbi:hypothetical protein Q010_00719 [Pseudomonas aeruginosa 19660]|nr:hypothetical protein Q010_00719 [Pseudomonas aeruginosa 19660]